MKKLLILASLLLLVSCAEGFYYLETVSYEYEEFSEFSRALENAYITSLGANSEKTYLLCNLDDYDVTYTLESIITKEQVSLSKKDVPVICLDRIDLNIKAKINDIEFDFIGLYHKEISSDSLDVSNLVIMTDTNTIVCSYLDYFDFYLKGNFSSEEKSIEIAKICLLNTKMISIASNNPSEPLE